MDKSNQRNSMISGISIIENELIRRIKLSKQQKCAALGAIIAGLISHLYGMVNLVFNDDTISAYYGLRDGNPYEIKSLFAGALSGRWFAGVANTVATWFRPPYMCGLIIILYAAITAVLVVRILDIESKVGAILIGGLIASFPAVLSFISLWDTGYMLSVLLCVIFVYLMEFDKRPVLSAAILGMGLGIMPVNIAVVIVLYLYVMIRKLFLNERIDKATFWNPIIRCTIIAVVGVLILYISIFLIPRLMGTSTEFSNYQGLDDAATGKWISNLPNNLISAFAKTRKLRIASMQLIPQLKFTLRICYGLQVLSVIYLLFRRKIFKDPLRFVLLLVCIVMLPFGISAICIVSPEFNYSLQHQMPWVFLISATWMLVEAVLKSVDCEESPNIRKICSVLFAFLCLNFLLLDYGFALTDNIVYRAQHYVTERDSALMVRVLAGLESTEGFDYNTSPVYIMNLQDVAYIETTRSPLAYEEDLYKTITTDIDTNLWCYSERSAKAHMSLYEGIDIKEPDDDVCERIMDQKIDIWNDHLDMQYGDYDIFRFEDTNTYVVVIKTAVSWGIVNNR